MHQSVPSFFFQSMQPASLLRIFLMMRKPAGSQCTHANHGLPADVRISTQLVSATDPLDQQILRLRALCKCMSSKMDVVLRPSMIKPDAHLAACITVLSCTFDQAAILMELRSPRSTAPYQMDTCREHIGRRTPGASSTCPVQVECLA